MEIIKQGKVFVNGKNITEPSTPIDPSKDSVEVDGKKVKVKTYEYILLNKPKGFVTTKKDCFAKKTVLDLLPKNLQHLYPVGRLDKDTEGLLILTNDGDLTLTLTHPRFKVGKTYIVKIDGLLTREQKDCLEKGVMLDGKKTSPAEIFKIKKTRENTAFDMTIHEGRKRQIRRMLEKIGHDVVSLKRISHGALKLGNLKIGTWRYLTEEEVAEIKKKF